MPNQEQINEKISQMNAAVWRYSEARTLEEKALADQLFSVCWQWLSQHGAAFHLDNETDAFVPGEVPAQAGEDPLWTWHDVFVDDIRRYGGYSRDKAIALIHRIIRAPQPHSLLHLENHQVVLTGRKPD